MSNVMLRSGAPGALGPLMRAATVSLCVTMYSSATLSHTLFIKPDTHWPSSGQSMVVDVHNGTFTENEARLPRKVRAQSLLIHPDGSRTELEESAWRHENKLAKFDFTAKSPGGYLISSSTHATQKRATAESFNRHLKFEGLDDQREAREQRAETATGVVERYSKFAKSIVSVDGRHSDNYRTLIGHPVEILPLENPHTLSVGDSLRVRLLKNGEPLSDTLIYASHINHYALLENGTIDELVRVRSDSRGEASIPLQATGKWYIRFIDLAIVDESEYWYSDLLEWLGLEEPRVFYESFWATLTFEVRAN